MSHVTPRLVATTLVVVILLSLLLIAADVAHANQGRQSNPVPALNPAMTPDFALQDVNGKGFRLSDFRGKVVVLEFMSTTCPHCMNEMSQLVSVWKSYGSSITMISVDLHSSDTDDTLKRFASSYNAPWVWARDTTGVKSAYQVQGVPEIFIISTGGLIAATFAGETSETALSQQIQAIMQSNIAAPTPAAAVGHSDQKKGAFFSVKQFVCQGNGDCVDASCVNGYCVATSGAPCPASEGQVSAITCCEGPYTWGEVCTPERYLSCENGMWSQEYYSPCPGQGGCQSNADCPADQTCGSNGQCVPKQGCQSDTDCPSGQTCSSGQCVPSQGGCQSNADCSWGICQDGQCVAECSSASDCPAGYTCVGGQCVTTGPPPGCQSDHDCPSGYICVNGQCLLNQCSPTLRCPEGYSCVNGECVPASACDPSDSSQYTQVGWDYKLQLSTLRTDKPSYLPEDRLEVSGSVVLSQRGVFLNEYCSKPYPIAYSDWEKIDPAAQVIITVQGVSQSFRVAADGTFSATLYLRSDWTAGDYHVAVTATGPAGYNGPTTATGSFTVHIETVTVTVTTVTWEYTTQTKTSVMMVTVVTRTVVVTVTSTTTTTSTVTTVTTTVTGDP